MESTILRFDIICLQVVSPSILAWGIYCAVIGVLFTWIKLINYKLHHLYDTGEAVPESPLPEGDDDAETGGKTDATEKG